MAKVAAENTLGLFYTSLFQNFPKHLIENPKLLVLHYSPVIVELDLPSALVGQVLAGPRCHVVADNLDVVDLISPQPAAQHPPDNRPHSAAKDDDGDVIFTSPGVKVFESGIEYDVLGQQLDALVIRRSHTVHHLLEAVPEVATPLEHVLVALHAQLMAESEVVRHEVIRVLLGDGAIVVGEEDDLGVCLERGKRRRTGRTHNCVKRSDPLFSSEVRKRAGVIHSG